MTEVASDEELGRVCRAVVAATMGHRVDIVRLDHVRNGEADVLYNRPSDETLWRIRCKMDGGALVWRTIDALGPGTGLGRWRNGPYDARITVAVQGNTIRVTQTFSDGSNIHDVEFSS